MPWPLTPAMVQALIREKPHLPPCSSSVRSFTTFQMMLALSLCFHCTWPLAAFAGVSPYLPHSLVPRNISLRTSTDTIMQMPFLDALWVTYQKHLQTGTLGPQGDHYIGIHIAVLAGCELPATVGTMNSATVSGVYRHHCLTLPPLVVGPELG